MAGLLPGDPSHHGMVENGPYSFSHDKLEEPDHSSCNWYLSRKEIEENSPSRKDGIDLKKETYFRKSYCTFLQDLGMRLKVPQVTIATAIIFCHRFFLRQSHAKNDRRTIATVCMFLAGKVEETPRPLKDVILVSYEMMNKKDPAAVQRIKQKEVYEQQKELILLGERVVLATLGFDLNVHHPYKPLVEAIKKFKVAQNALAQVAWNFVNDGLRTSLCLQFKPHHIAAGAIFLAAKFLKVKLPSDGEKVWWQEFDVTPRQLEEVSNQMLELYEQNRTAPLPSHTNEGEGVSDHHRGVTVKVPSAAEDPLSGNSQSSAAAGVGIQKQGSQEASTIRVGPDHSTENHHSLPSRNSQHQSNDYGSTDARSDYKVFDGSVVNRDRRHHDLDQFCSVGKENAADFPIRSRNITGLYLERNETAAETEWKDEGLSHKLSGNSGGQNSSVGEGPKGYGPPDAIKKIDKEKVKAALEKRRKSRGDVTRKADVMDEYDIIERELENGVELAAEDERIRQERRQGWSSNNQQQPLHWVDADNDIHHKKTTHNVGDSNFSLIDQHSAGNVGGRKMRSASIDLEELVHGAEPDVIEIAEEGELSSYDLPPREFHSPKSGSRKKRPASPNRRRDHPPLPSVANYLPRDHQTTDDGRLDHLERDHKRHR